MHNFIKTLIQLCKLKLFGIFKRHEWRLQFLWIVDRERRNIRFEMERIAEVYAFGSNSEGQLGLRQSDLPNEYLPKTVESLREKDIFEMVSSQKSTAAT